MIGSTLTREPAAEISGIADWLARTSGISTRIIGSQTLRRAIQQRQNSTGLADLSDYEQRLLASAEEQQCLVELVVVPETWFFRDRHPYGYLRQHVAGLLRDGLPSQPLRLLSAPCATGEEPYSMAMTLLEMGLPSRAFQIDGIDICRRAIRKAQQAVYGRHSFRGVSELEKQRSFQPTAQGLALHPSIRETVRFQCANLMTCLAGSSSRYDVIFCRNLLIYLQDSASEQLLASLGALLRPGGLLIVGSAETAKVPASLFTPIRASFVFGFLRRDPQSAPAAPQPSSDAAPPSGSRLSSSGTSRPTSGRSSRRARPRAASAGRVSSRPPREMSLPDRHNASASVDPELWRCQQELQRDPTSASAYLRLGQWLLQHKREEEAMQCLRKCLYLSPDCREAMQAMIEVSRQLGQLQRSRQVAARLARLDR